MKEGVTFAAAADFHIRSKDSQEFTDESYERILSDASKDTDFLILCGDIVVSSSASRAAGILEAATVPVLFVPGNHDRDKPTLDTLSKSKNVTIMDGRVYTFQTEAGPLHIVGVTGDWDGSFHQIEPPFDKYNYNNLRPSKRLEQELERLDELLRDVPNTEAVVVAMHYAPVRGRSIGMINGSVRLGEVIDSRRNPDNTMVLHGHMHYGDEIATSSGGIKVYNVSLNVLSMSETLRDLEHDEPLKTQHCFRLFSYSRKGFTDLSLQRYINRQ